MFAIICEAIIVITVLGMAACAAAGMYVAKCDEMTKEMMGIKI